MNRRKQIDAAWLWRWHNLLVGFVAFAGIGMAIGASYFTVPVLKLAQASENENVNGWAWADPTGWISLNGENLGSNGGNYGVNVDLNTGLMNGFGWSENAGWICFGNSCNVPECRGAVPNSFEPYQDFYAVVLPPPRSPGPTIRNFHGWAKVCNAGDDGWISLNCQDPSPQTCGNYPYRVALDMSTLSFEDRTAPGSPDNGASFAWNGGSEGRGLGYIDFKLAKISVPAENTDLLCADGVDNDLDSALDCGDNSCSATVPCAPPPQDLREDECPDGAEECCKDNFDNEGDGKIDCEDTDCQETASMCTVAWLKTKFGNVYAQKGIESITAPANQFNATYCLSNSDGNITGFASQVGCTMSSPLLALPKKESQYRSSLGFIDLAGIENGRYGAVIPIADGLALPEALNGKVYIYNGRGTIALPAKNFLNGFGPTGRGNGLLYVKGGDLMITADMSYPSPTVQSYLRNLASFGAIVTKDPATGNGGNIFIDPAVTEIVGAYFAENVIRTGSSGDSLTVYGLLASHLLSFERKGGNAETPSETVIFDGRAVANPPPGMQDIGKSLPSSKDAF